MRRLHGLKSFQKAEDPLKTHIHKRRLHGALFLTTWNLRNFNLPKDIATVDAHRYVYISARIMLSRQPLVALCDNSMFCAIYSYQREVLMLLVLARWAILRASGSRTSNKYSPHVFFAYWFNTNFLLTIKADWGAIGI